MKMDFSGLLARGRVARILASLGPCLILIATTGGVATSAGRVTAAGTAGPSAARKASEATAPAQTAPPFARVYLAVRGCTSCSHCRTAIRQMVRSNAGGGEARIGDDQVEVRYQTPRTVPLRDVIRSLAESRLHDLDLVDVLFEARGTIAPGQGGTATFILAETGQSFPISIDRALNRPADGKPVRLTAVVDGWRKKGALSLSAKEFRPAG